MIWTQIRFEDRKKGDIGNDICFPSMSLIFALQWTGARVFIPTNLKRVVFNSRLVCASKLETFAGGVGHVHPGYGMIFQFLETSWWHICCLGSKLRRIRVTMAASLSMLNAPMVCWQTLIQQWSWWRQEFGVNRRPSMNGLRIGRYYAPHTIMNFRTPNSFWHYCHAYPAYSCSKPFVSCRIQW